MNPLLARQHETVGNNPKGFDGLSATEYPLSNSRSQELEPTLWHTRENDISMFDSTPDTGGESQKP